MMPMASHNAWISTSPSSRKAWQSAMKWVLFNCSTSLAFLICSSLLSASNSSSQPMNLSLLKSGRFPHCLSLPRKTPKACCCLSNISALDSLRWFAAILNEVWQMMPMTTLKAPRAVTMMLMHMKVPIRIPWIPPTRKKAWRTSAPQLSRVASWPSLHMVVHTLRYCLKLAGVSSSPPHLAVCTIRMAKKYKIKTTRLKAQNKVRIDMMKPSMSMASSLKARTSRTIFANFRSRMSLSALKKPGSPVRTQLSMTLMKITRPSKWNHGSVNSVMQPSAFLTKTIRKSHSMMKMIKKRDSTQSHQPIELGYSVWRPMQIEFRMSQKPKKPSNFAHLAFLAISAELRSMSSFSACGMGKVTSVSPTLLDSVTWA
mmetsp:Transcript_52473/g.152730  ORF Transcript_52473/g.152730 Transcript_52473/m.152730 type:complete len:371 (+) Transcript_52473:2989-4101(+)